MKLGSICAAVLLVFAGLAGCSSDSGGGSDIVGPIGGDDGGDQDGSDTGNEGVISFSTEVLSIFHSTCGSSGCHINNARNGVELTTYATTMASSGTRYGGLVVVAGSAEGSPLVDKIEPNPTIGDRMPDGRPALSQAQINTIRQWIDQGAQNN